MSIIANGSPTTDFQAAPPSHPTCTFCDDMPNMPSRILYNNYCAIWAQ